ncbi:MAG: DUF1292 domain-containing protein [Oscillospiraceae bacterium]|nr:DUF1292 domain-containing protein [Oscillospiraceae bacterium]
MSEDFGSTFVTIEDEDGNEIELEYLDTAIVDDIEYMAFTSADNDPDSEEVEIFILRVEEEEDEQILATIEEEDEMQRVYEVFMTRLEEEDEDLDDEE